MSLLDDLTLLNDIQESLKLLEKHSTSDSIIIKTILKLRKVHVEKIVNNDLMKTNNLLQELTLLSKEQTPVENYKEKMINQTRSYYSTN